MSSFFQRLKTSGSFASNIATLGTGTAVGQLSIILLAPILTRLYGPRHFGDLQVIVSISLILGTLASLRYDQAIPLPKANQKAYDLLAISAISSIVFSFGLVLISVLVLIYGSGFEKIDQLGGLILFIPLLVVTDTGMNMLSTWSMRHADYKSAAFGRFVSGMGIGSSQIMLFVVGLTKGIGLVAGQVAGQLMATIYLLLRLTKLHSFKNVQLSSRVELVSRMKEYKAFPMIASWNALLNTIARNLPAIVLAFFFPLEVVGYFALGMRLVNLPLNLVGGAIGQVFYQQMSKFNREGISTVSFFISTTLKLLAIIVVPMLVIYFEGGRIFSLFLGESWNEAGVIASILVPFFLIRFIVAPLSSVFAVFGKQHLSLLWQILYAVVTFFMFYVGGSKLEFHVLMEYYSWTSAALFLILYSIALTVVLREGKKPKFEKT